MKDRVLALALALILALALVPSRAFAAQLKSLPEPALMPMAQGALPQPQAKTYSVTMTYSGSGKAELYNTSAGAGESIYFMADPEPGYRVSFEKCGYIPEPGEKKVDIFLKYIGANIYELKMPAGDVVLDLEFVKIETASHKVKLSVAAGGMASVDQKTAKKGESLFVEVITGPGYSNPSVRTVSGGREAEGYYLSTVAGAKLFEVFMTDADLEIIVEFDRNGPYTVTAHVGTGGKLELSHKSAYELETVTITAKPDRGYQVASISAGRSQLQKVKENVWSFSMPRSNEQIMATFAPVVYPVRATLEVALGGTVALSAQSATIGQTVTLTCVPDAGYRVARVTGAKVTDIGNNTYTFVMDNAAVELKVLFLREDNPFLDVNETQYFYDSVLWAMEEGITAGISANAFGPLEHCNRAQVVTFLWRAAGCPAPKNVENPFTDVAAGAWYTDAVLWAVEKGITAGLSANTFGPTADCNRAQVVTFLHRANGSVVPAPQQNPFTDVQAGSWYEQPVLWALQNGVTAGTSQTTFDPEGKCLRGQVVTFLCRADRIAE